MDDKDLVYNLYDLQRHGEELLKVIDFLFNRGFYFGRDDTIDSDDGFSCPKCHCMPGPGPGMPIAGGLYKTVKSTARGDKTPLTWNITLYHCGNCKYKTFYIRCIGTKEEPDKPDENYLKKHFPELFE